MTEKINVHVASQNPVKVKAAQQALESVFPNIIIDVKGFKAESGISDQPVGLEETLQGARNRVEKLLKSNPNADFFVGMEGGVHYFNEKCYAFAWMFIKSKGGKTGQAMTGFFELPKEIASLLDEGLELGHAIDRHFSQENSKQKGGAVGMLTDGRLDRTEYYVHAMLLALIPFVKSEYY